MLLTFLLVVIGWVFFRAETITDAFAYLGGIFDSSLLSVPFIPSGTIRTFASINILLLVEWCFRLKNHPFEISKFNIISRYFIYYILILIILEFGANSQSFIYFQF
jgi:hypothetical protein